MRSSYVKENEVLKKANYCPFCDENELNRKNKRDYGNGILFIENKYQVNLGCECYLLIENSDCKKTLHNSDLGHVLNLLIITESLKNEFECSGKYDEVVVFKQFGRLSGSSVEHGHIQIVGLNGLSSDKSKIENSRCGDLLFENDSFKIILSSNPVSEVCEINIEYKDLSLELIEKMQRILNYYIESSEGFFEGGHYSVSLHTTCDGFKLLKLVNRKVTSTYKSNLGISLLPNVSDTYLSFLKSLVN